MKESKIAPKVLVAVIFLAVVAYLVLSLVQGLHEEVVTANAYNYTQDVGVEARGIIIRSEQPLTGDGGYLDMILAEGEKAAVGDPVALLYSDPSALTTRQNINSLTDEIEQLQFVLDSLNQGSQDAGAMDQQILQYVTQLRSLTASGDLSALEDTATDLRAAVFRRAYTFEDSSAADQLRALIASKQSQLAGLSSSLGQVSRTVYAPVSGVYSGQTDGWEMVVSPAILDSLTPESLDELLREQHSPTPMSAGKLIMSSTWYFAALLPPNDRELNVGSTYSISFSDGTYQRVDMKLQRVEFGDKNTLAIFATDADLATTTLMRVQTVDVIAEQLTGVRIPRKALRIITEVEETTDPETGATSSKEVNHYGVYCVISAQAEWKEVHILYTDDTYYLVRPVDATARNRLRSGDVVILSGSDLYDGKVVR